MDRIACLCVGSVEKHIHAGRMAVGEANCLQGRFRRIEVGPAQHQVHILSVAHRRLVDARHPGRDSVATNRRVWNSSFVQRVRRAQSPFSDFLHGSQHPFPRDFAKRYSCHMTILSEKRRDQLSRTGRVGEPIRTESRPRRHAQRLEQRRAEILR